jgi:F0F1-type ATP synthase assembly protein I
MPVEAATMDYNPDSKDDATKAKFQRMANRQTGIVMAGVIVGMGIGNIVSEEMAGQSFWLRALAVGLSTGLTAGICAQVMGKFWRQ